jgi:KDO2-lipid IV(A) lauroyltransferase
MRRKLFGALLYLFSLLPFPVLYLLSDLLFLVLYYLVAYRRDVVAANLQNAFPEKNAVERDEIGRKFYRFLSDQLLESFKMRTLSRKELKRRFTLNNIEEVQQHFARGKGVIAATGHYANWEWGALILTATLTEPVIIVYKPIRDKIFEAMVNSMRSRFGAIMVSMKNTLRKIVEYRNQPFFAVLVSDQTPVAHETQYFTTFLSQPTAVFLGVEKLARMSANPVVFCHIDQPKRGHYNCTFTTLTDDPAATSEYAITEMHTRKLEEIIRHRPELWLWSHKRWKFKPSTA